MPNCRSMSLVRFRPAQVGKSEGDAGSVEFVEQPQQSWFGLEGGAPGARTFVLTAAQGLHLLIQQSSQVVVQDRSPRSASVNEIQVDARGIEALLGQEYLPSLLVEGMTVGDHTIEVEDHGCQGGSAVRGSHSQLILPLDHSQLILPLHHAMTQGGVDGVRSAQVHILDLLHVVRGHHQAEVATVPQEAALVAGEANDHGPGFARHLQPSQHVAGIAAGRDSQH